MTLLPTPRPAPFVPLPTGLWVESENPANRDAWLEERKTYLGASDIPVLFGCGYGDKTPAALWLEKKGLAPDIDWTGDRQKIRTGNAIEPVILQLWQEENPGWAMVKPECRAACDQAEFLQASLDAIYATPDFEFGTGELKNTTIPITATTIPERWLIQVQTQLLCTGFEKGYLVCLVSGWDLRVFPIYRDADIQEEILRRARWFWDLIETNTPPPIDFATESRKVVEAFNPIGDTPETITATNSPAVAEYLLAKAAAKDAEARVKEAENRLIAEAMGSAAGVTDYGLGVEITRSTRSRTTYDVPKEIQATYPAKTTTYTTLTIRNLK